MSFCAASCCTCSPRASSVSATSASSPIADAPHYCRYVSRHWPQFHRRPNQKPPLPRNRTLFGVAPSAADRWLSSNDFPRLKSNSALHHGWSRLRLETARPQIANSARFPALCPRPPGSWPDPYFAPSVRPFSIIDPPPTCSPTFSSPPCYLPPNFNTSPSPHSICITPASAAPAASF